MNPEEDVEFAQRMHDATFNEPEGATPEEMRKRWRGTAEDLEKALARKFKAMRESRGWSQSYMCQQLKKHGLDIHQTTLAKIEAGSRPLRISDAHIFAFTFELPLNMVYQLDGLDINEHSNYSLNVIQEELSFWESTEKQYRESIMQTLDGMIDGAADSKARIAHLTSMYNRISRDKAMTTEENRDDE
ncbi:helix-turn-helix transcriptional regulator [Rothia terrae]|uniref:helix-turn-helix transcriptional regulator n=1 Tax=Rothia terrae TaxID=396015 RepID=UPI0033E8291B